MNTLMIINGAAYGQDATYNAVHDGRADRLDPGR